EDCARGLSAAAHVFEHPDPAQPPAPAEGARLRRLLAAALDASATACLIISDGRNTEPVSAGLTGRKIAKKTRITARPPVAWREANGHWIGSSVRSPDADHA